MQAFQVSFNDAESIPHGSFASSRSVIVVADTAVAAIRFAASLNLGVVSGLCSVGEAYVADDGSKPG